jgi:hypothetical protein
MDLSIFHFHNFIAEKGYLDFVGLVTSAKTSKEDLYLVASPKIAINKLKFQATKSRRDDELSLQIFFLLSSRLGITLSLDYMYRDGEPKIKKSLLHSWPWIDSRDNTYTFKPTLDTAIVGVPVAFEDFYKQKFPNGHCLLETLS